MATAADSTYAGIVALARQAAAETAPWVRLADRMAWFVPSRSPSRVWPGCSAARPSAVAVLVATPSAAAGRAGLRS
ncbi:MAG: hypothetical protein H6522_04315 [Mycolicibacterium sp.]|nr:hypothetical protein [Mycolicibacterium sp.]